MISLYNPFILPPMFIHGLFIVSSSFHDCPFIVSSWFLYSLFIVFSCFFHGSIIIPSLSLHGLFILPSWLHNCPFAIISLPQLSFSSLQKSLEESFNRLTERISQHVFHYGYKNTCTIMAYQTVVFVVF